MKWALIINGIVFEATNINPVGRFSEDLPWIECPSECEVGWSYSGTVFSTPPPQPQSMQPDENGFIQAIKGGLGGIVGANALAVAYPLFFIATQAGEWEDVQTLIFDSKTKSIISETQYAAIKLAASEFNIPIEL